MISFLRKDRWSPYFVGTSIGLLLTGMFLFGSQIGASTGISKIPALLEQLLIPSRLVPSTYFYKLLHASSSLIDFRILFILGLFCGALIASQITREAAPPKNLLWEKTYGSSKNKRHLAAFAGGAILLFGARIADGCTSGHAISGGAQLSIASWTFMMAVFATAIPTAFFLYRRRSS